MQPGEIPGYVVALEADHHSVSWLSQWSHVKPCTQRTHARTRARTYARTHARTYARTHARTRFHQRRGGRERNAHATCTRRPKHATTRILPAPRFRADWRTATLRGRSAPTSLVAPTAIPPLDPLLHPPSPPPLAFSSATLGLLQAHPALMNRPAPAATSYVNRKKKCVLVCKISRPMDARTDCSLAMFICWMSHVEFARRMLI